MTKRTIEQKPSIKSNTFHQNSTNAADYISPQGCSWVVISRPGPDLQWHLAAKFVGPIQASDYCIFQRKRATNPGFECMFFQVND